MMALSKRMPEQEPSEVEMLLPWHAAGTLNARDARRVEEALAHDDALARQYAAIREEYAETIALNESLGAPSSRALQKLFAAIDMEPARETQAPSNRPSRVADFFAGLSPRKLAWSAGLAAVLLVLQAGVIAAFLIKDRDRPATFQTASLRMNETSLNAPVTRALGPQQTPPRALVRFKADARISDIIALLDTYQATIIGGGQGGMFRLQFNGGAITQAEAARLVGKLQNEKIVGQVAESP
jgi:anti-sigma factor RsiW